MHLNILTHVGSTMIHAGINIIFSILIVSLSHVITESVGLTLTKLRMMNNKAGLK